MRRPPLHQVVMSKHNLRTYLVTPIQRGSLKRRNLPISGRRLNREMLSSNHAENRRILMVRSDRFDSSPQGITARSQDATETLYSDHALLNSTRQSNRHDLLRFQRKDPLRYRRHVSESTFFSVIPTNESTL